MEASARQLAHELLEWTPEQQESEKETPSIELLISAAQGISDELRALKLLLSEKTGMNFSSHDWNVLYINIGDALSTALFPSTTPGSPQRANTLNLKRFNHPIGALIIHQDLLPFVEDLRACAPGRNDQGVAAELGRRKSKLPP
jgi:hypothetical protein